MLYWFPCLQIPSFSLLLFSFWVKESKCQLIFLYAQLGLFNIVLESIKNCKILNIFTVSKMIIWASFLSYPNCFSPPLGFLWTYSQKVPILWNLSNSSHQIVPEFDTINWSRSLFWFLIAPNRTLMILSYHVTSSMSSFVCGALMDGKSRSRDSYRFQLEGHQQDNQIPVFSFIRTRHISWLFMRLSLPFTKQQN